MKTSISRYHLYAHRSLEPLNLEQIMLTLFRFRICEQQHKISIIIYDQNADDIKW